MSFGTSMSLRWLLAMASMAGAAVAEDTAAPRIPLCPGLTVVTAVEQQAGDYESIKTIESVEPGQVRMKYSSEMPNTDLLDPGPPIKKVNLHRVMLTADLESGAIYQQNFVEKSAETIPGATSIGTSAAVLRALKTKGEAQVSVSNSYPGLELSADRSKFPNYYSYLVAGTLERVGSGAVRVRVLVNDQLVELPAIQAQGDFVGDKDEFFFLDDERNPLTLSFRLGIGGIKPLTPEQAAFCKTMAKASSSAANYIGGGRCDKPNGADRDTLRVVKISCRCEGPADGPSAGNSGGGGGGMPGGAGAGGAGAIERALADTGKADVYSIYFTFNSDAIREESEPTLKEIAEVLRRHAGWKLRVGGHTDGVGGDQYNLDLSRRRAVAVRDALVKRYAIDAGRLAAAGFGKSQPKDTNETLEGRARNRRVELVRQ
ncbi:MAG TPA: OmpA family protein [Bryobacteraceae bacterium]|nr:OmpA family protein [Bryobacteraceae bacterium]